MIGTTIKIWKVERELTKIQQDDIEKQGNQVDELLKDLHLVVSRRTERKELSYLINAVCNWIQIKTMMVTCFWAAIAALFACISTVFALITVLSN